MYKLRLREMSIQIFGPTKRQRDNSDYNPLEEYFRLVDSKAYQGLFLTYEEARGPKLWIHHLENIYPRQFEFDYNAGFYESSLKSARSTRNYPSIYETQIFDSKGTHHHIDGISDETRLLISKYIFSPSKTRFKIQFLGLSSMDGLQNHMNILIYDLTFKELVRFEPHGETNLFDQPFLNDFLENWAKEEGVKYIFESRTKVQYYNKFCVVWCLLFVHYVLKINELYCIENPERAVSISVLKEDAVNMMQVFCNTQESINSYVSYMVSTILEDSKLLMQISAELSIDEILDFTEAGLLMKQDVVLPSRNFWELYKAKGKSRSGQNTPAEQMINNVNQHIRFLYESKHLNTHSVCPKTSGLSGAISDTVEDLLGQVEDLKRNILEYWNSDKDGSFQNNFPDCTISSNFLAGKQFGGAAKVFYIIIFREIPSFEIWSDNIDDYDAEYVLENIPKTNEDWQFMMENLRKTITGTVDECVMDSMKGALPPSTPHLET